MLYFVNFGTIILNKGIQFCSTSPAQEEEPDWSRNTSIEDYLGHNITNDTFGM